MSKSCYVLALSHLEVIVLFYELSFHLSYDPGAGHSFIPVFLEHLLYAADTMVWAGDTVTNDVLLLMQLTCRLVRWVQTEQTGASTEDYLP